MWKQLTADKNPLHDSNPSSSLVSKSYYIRKYKAFQERVKKQEEEEKRQRAIQRKREREDRCADIMTYLAFSRVYEWIITFGLIFITIVTPLKLDGIIDWSWAAILIPFYFIILQFIYAPIMYDSSSVYFDKNFEDRMADDNRYCGPIFYLLFFMIPLGTYSNLPKRLLVYCTTGTI